MTPIDSEHAALLRGIAANTNDKIAQKVYADWLQEHGNPGWVIVLNYRIQDWPVKCDRDGAVSGGMTRYAGYWRLPWLAGICTTPKHGPFNYRVTDPRSRIKRLLLAYADGKTIKPKQENEDGEES